MSNMYIVPYRQLCYNTGILGEGPSVPGRPPERRSAMPASKAQQKAVSKYMKENYDEIKVRTPKGQKDLIQAHAAAQGESVNGFINRAITETMERDGRHGDE